MSCYWQVHTCWGMSTLVHCKLHVTHPSRVQGFAKDPNFQQLVRDCNFKSTCSTTLQSLNLCCSDSPDHHHHLQICMPEGQANALQVPKANICLLFCADVHSSFADELGWAGQNLLAPAVSCWWVCFCTTAGLAAALNCAIDSELARLLQKPAGATATIHYEIL